MAFAVMAALVLGLMSGLLTAKARERYCGRCGAGLACLDCVHRDLEVNSGLPRRRI